MTDNNTQARKQSAVQFLKLAVAGRFDEAYDKHVDLQGKHHNTYSPAGFPALRQAMIENHDQFPARKFSIRNVLGEGDLVAVHSHVVLRPSDPGMAVVHLFRFQNDKIVEMWDIGQPVPADSPNKDGAF